LTYALQRTQVITIRQAGSQTASCSSAMPDMGKACSELPLTDLFIC
jgi:hypothetical protein